MVINLQKPLPLLVLLCLVCVRQGFGQNVGKVAPTILTETQRYLSTTEITWEQGEEESLQLALEKVLSFPEHQQADTLLVALARLESTSDKLHPHEVWVLFHVLKGVGLTSKQLYSEAITYFTQAQVGLDSLSSWQGLTPWVQLGMARLNIELRNYEASVEIHHRWIAAWEELLTPRPLAQLYHNYGVANLHLKHYDSAEVAFQQSLAVKQALQDTLGLAITSMDLANLYYAQYKDNLAIPRFQQALQMAKQAGDTSVLKTAELNMAVVEENRKEYAAALVHRKEYERLLTAEWNRDRIWALAEQQKEFAVATKQQEVEVLEAREAQQQAELARQQIQQRALLATAGLLALIVGVILWSYRQLRGRNQQISQQKEELTALNQAKNQLFAMVAHDLKAPVLSLQRSQQGLSRALRKQDLKRVEVLAGENETLTARTYQLLNNVLHWAMEQTEQLRMQKEITPVVPLLEQVIYDYTGVARTRGIILQQDLVPVGWISVDVQLMKIVLRNLLDNALKFTPKGGTVSVALAEESGQVRISVQDTGVGMEEQHWAQLQNETQLATSGQDVDGQTSTGLGLQLSMRLVHRQGGTLQLTSQLHQGTTVTLIFPQESSPV